MIAPTTYDLEDTVRGLVATGSGLDFNQVIQGNDDGPTPDGIFASLVLIHQATEGIPSTAMRLTADGLSLDAPTVATIRGRYSVQWFREGARDAARRFSVWVYSPRGLQSAQEAGLTVRRVSDVRQLDEVVSAAWEERAGVDLDLGYRQAITETVDYLQAIPIEVRAGGVTETITVEV